jgi:hypothetical protein
MQSKEPDTQRRAPAQRCGLRAAAVLLPGLSLLLLADLAAQAPSGGLPASRGAFVPDLGQWGREGSWRAGFGPIRALLDGAGFSLTVFRPDGPEADPASAGKCVRDRGWGTVSSATVRMSFLGADPAAERVPEQRLPGHHNYILGSDPSSWRREVPLYASLRYRDLYPGIDLRVRSSDGVMEYDLLLAPGAELGRVEVRVEGAEGLGLGEGGSLVVDTALGPIVQPPPVSWQVDPDGRQHPVRCEFVLLGEDRFGFTAPGLQPDWELVVDPKLIFSTLVGSSSDDYTNDLKVDGAGRTLICGTTLANDYPTTPGVHRQVFAGGIRDGFVTVFDRSGSNLVFSTFVGGSGHDGANGLAIDGLGLLHVVGETDSADFPTTSNAYASSPAGAMDAFYLQLDPTGSVLVYSTYLGSPGADQGVEVAVDAAGIATLLGRAAAGFPTTPGSYGPTFKGGPADIFVARLDPSLPGSQQLTYGTYLGGSAGDAGWSLAVDPGGVITLAGDSWSADFPTTAGAYDTSFNGGRDLVLCRLDPSLPAAQQLVWSTFVGGVGDDWLFEIGLSPQGVTFGGETTSTLFPTTPGSFRPAFHGGPGDGFVARLSDDGSTLLWSTYIGASADDQVVGLGVDAMGFVSIVGWTQQHGLFPTTPGVLKRARQANEGYVARLSPDGSRLLFSTYLGGSGQDGAWRMVVDQAGVVTTAGATTHGSFPTTPGAYSRTYAGGTNDAFVTRLPTIPDGVVRYGDTSPDCSGKRPTIHALDDAVAGSTTFGFGMQAQANTAALLLLSTQRSAGLPLFGFTTWVDLPGLLVPPPSLSTSGTGELNLLLSIPAGTSARLAAQFVLFDPTGCPGNPFSASDAIEVAW